MGSFPLGSTSAYLGPDRVGSGAVLGRRRNIVQDVVKVRELGVVGKQRDDAALFSVITHLSVCPLLQKKCFPYTVSLNLLQDPPARFNRYRTIQINRSYNSHEPGSGFTW